MNRTLTAIAFAIAAAAAAPVLADDITIDPNEFVSTKSRAEVRAELDQYRSAGVNPWADDHDQLRAFESTLSRDEVVGEFLQARQEVAAMSGEDSGSAYLALQSHDLPAPVLAGFGVDAGAQ